MRNSLWIVVLALLAQASAGVSRGLKEDAKNKVLDVADAAKEYTDLVSKLENTTNFEVNSINHNRTDENGRILGGTPLTAATFVSPLTAYAFVRATNAATVTLNECGGVILSPLWVLTAAHCVALAARINVFAGLLADPTGVAAATSRAKAIIHPDFRLNFLTNNIALLNLYTPLKLSGTVGTALLSTVVPSFLLDNNAFTTLGFGQANDSPFVSGTSTLNVIDMQNMNRATCDQQTIAIFVTYPANTGCLNTATGTKGICKADPGGPVFHTSPTEDVGKIIGINSQIVGCPRQEPSSFTWIFPYITWIQAKTFKQFT